MRLTCCKTKGQSYLERMREKVKIDRIIRKRPVITKRQRCRRRCRVMGWNKQKLYTMKEIKIYFKLLTIATKRDKHKKPFWGFTLKCLN